MSRELRLNHYIFCLEDRLGYIRNPVYKHVFHFSQEKARSKVRESASRKNWKIRWVEDKGLVKPGLKITGESS